MVFQHAAAEPAVGLVGAGGQEGLDDFVGQVVFKWSGDGQHLHLLGGHHPPNCHPAHVLQAGNALRTLPEVHATITSPERREVV